MKVKEQKKKTFPLYPYLLQGQQALSGYKPISVGSPGDVRYTTPLPHPTTPNSTNVQAYLDFHCVHYVVRLHNSEKISLDISCELSSWQISQADISHKFLRFILFEKKKIYIYIYIYIYYIYQTTFDQRFILDSPWTHAKIF